MRETMSEEFNLIDRYFLPLCQPLAEGEVGIGDDGAVITPPSGQQLVVVTDTLVKGVHFPNETCAYDIAWKALAVNLSDLAAMGAIPGFYTLALTLPENEQAWLTEFARGLKDLGERYQVALIGGDTTRGPLTVTVTAHGWVPNRSAVLRSGARVGDLICVSGALGCAGLGLKVALNTLSENEQAWFTDDMVESCLQVLNRPQPQLDLGLALRDVASAAIDVSDGLLADLGHILEQSSKHALSILGAELYLDALPLSEAVGQWVSKTGDWSLPLVAGDDYQLCFTLPEESWQALQQEAAKLEIEVHTVGRVTDKNGIEIKQSLDSETCVDAPWCDGLKAGYQHF